MRGDPYKMGQTPHNQQKKSNIILEGSRHPNFTNTFDYDKTFLDKLFPQRIWNTCPNRIITKQYIAGASISNSLDFSGHLSNFEGRKEGGGNCGLDRAFSH